jgi:predicted GNAT superfamily acetyltransferase
MSLYKDYVAETYGKNVYETDFGFAVYSYPTNNMVYIEDIYITPDVRQSGAASTIADAIVQEARAIGCTKLLGSVNLTITNPARSMKVLLAYGMRPSNQGPNILYFEKDI